MKLHELLTQALDDIVTTKKEGLFEIDMGTWVETYPLCRACLAGCWLIQRHPNQVRVFTVPALIGYAAEMNAIDCLRNAAKFQSTVNLNAALRAIGQPETTLKVPEYDVWVDPHTDLDSWVLEYRKFAEWLKENNL